MTLKRNLIANYLGQGWTALMGLAFVPLYIKYLGIEAYGVIGLFAVLQAWLGLLDMGMTPTLVREMAHFTGGSRSNESIRDLLRSTEIIAVGMAVLITGGITLSSNWIATSWLKANALPVEVVAQAFDIMGLVTALRFVEGVYRSAIVGLQRQVLLNVVNCTMATLRGLGAVWILIWISPSIEAFFLWQAMISITTLTVLNISTYASISKGTRGGSFSMEALHSTWRFAGGMVSITFFALLLTQIDKILLSKLLTLHEFGYYTLASTIAGTLYSLITPITETFYPKFCELHARDDRTALINNYHKGAQLVSVIAGSVALIVACFSETFLKLWTQDADLARSLTVLLSLLMVGNLLNSLMWIPYQMQLAHGLTRLSAYINLIAVIFIVPTIIWVTPNYGAIGAAYVWIILNVGYIFIGAQFIYQKVMVKEKYRWYKNDILAPLIIALLTISITKATVNPMENIITQVLTLAITLIVTMFASAMTADLIRHQVQTTAKTILKRLFLTYQR
ncbi:MAG: polysaccharide biosynthesis protein [Bacteroidia bacterium]|nr:polysaccharide biosynthesis protein [Bacteroidia bacterium]